MRPQDRLIACELEPRSAASLKAALARRAARQSAGDRRLDALNAKCPPKERRGLVLIGSAVRGRRRLHAAAGGASRRAPQMADRHLHAWYPIKEREAPGRAGAAARAAWRAENPALRDRAWPARADAGLIGSGLIAINPPFTLERELRVLLPALGRAFSPDAVHRIDWLAREG